MKKKYSLPKLMSLFACCALISACATSPTGRKQLVFMPDAQLNQMGLQAFDDLKSKKPISHSNRSTTFVNCIAEALIYEVGGDWEVVVFDDTSLNAFALPGNKIGVHTGLIDLVDNQDQLAAVIGHEIGHVMARHSNERMSQKTAAKVGVALVTAVSSPETQLGKMAVGMLGIGAQYGVILPFSRTHESEADVIGLDLMAKAGFDPRESVTLWQKMAAAGNGKHPPEILSTHPAHSTRINGLSKNIPAAMQHYNKALSIGKRPNCKK